MALSITSIPTRDGLITLCANCSSLKITEARWISVIGANKPFLNQIRGKRLISHGICPKCMETLYGDLSDDETSITHNPNE